MPLTTPRPLRWTCPAYLRYEAQTANGTYRVWYDSTSWLVLLGTEILADGVADEAEAVGVAEGHFKQQQKK